MSRPDSIRNIGLRNHLEATKAEHNNRGYAEFVKYLELGEEYGEPLPVVKLARAFSVTTRTLEKWLIIYHEEQVHSKQ